MLTKFAQNVWIADIPLKFYGVETGTRMTVIKLKQDKLFIHSPISLTPTLKKEVDKLGKVSFIVSPIKIHNLFLEPWMQAYPKAKVYASPGLIERRKDLRFDAELKENAPNEWRSEIEQTIFKGSSLMQEVVFFHKPSKTLIMTDFIQRYDEDKPLYTRLFARLDGMYQRYGVARDLKFTMRKGKEQVKQSATRILKWDFSSIIIAHGKPVKKNAKKVFKDCFNFVL